MTGQPGDDGRVFIRSWWQVYDPLVECILAAPVLALQTGLEVVDCQKLVGEILRFRKQAASAP